MVDKMSALQIEKPTRVPADPAVVADLYLDLLKRSLTNTVFTVEPNADQENQFRYIDEFIKHYINTPAISMLPRARFDNLQQLIDQVIAVRVPGDFIEAGVWRGGAAIFMRAMLKAYGINDRIVYVADSFEGLPEPDSVKYPIEAKAHHGPTMEKAFEHFACSLEEVQQNFQAYGMLDKQVQFLKGWFKDTLPRAPMPTLALMRLDGDYYESTMDSLTNLYDKLSPKGYVIVDDYGEDMWTYCRKAVDDFRRTRGIVEPMVRVDSKCYYWQRLDG